MNTAQKIFGLLGFCFTLVGTVLTVSFVAAGEWNMMIGIPVLFALLGMGFLVAVAVWLLGQRRIKTEGKKYPAKIYSYVPNTSIVVNDAYTINTKVHYFDEHHIEREAVIPTSFCAGSEEYPIGMTMDIYEYHGKYSFDPDSVRDERLPGEEELMDNKPVNPEKLNMVAVTCQSCGASYSAASGYTGRCPYCGTYQTVEE
mgnify:FL=1